ncbi:hypothetical protein [Kineosporia sp. NBRC 101731]|uniref:hypothetical protein n=1 Tax=Kineosporia sp. NBRC 101731 TaxID=3032199 RepID=UPI0024A05F99|nr:hypothetical protein [Kineosporia sp. NBRC 101731]GLY31999.1 hypothetical protein Kisp02_53640 [Kineosporia sp. NBRC 101731]
MSADRLHLWDYDHPYYACEGNYYKRDHAHRWASWAEFMSELGSSDEDLNLIYRWDWFTPDPTDYEDGEEIPSERINLFFILQRKAICMSAHIDVTRDQEPEIRAFLVKRARTVAQIWEPIGVEL